MSSSANKTKIMFVCMGNICRSPTAHAVMQNLLDTRGLNQQISVQSAGTHAYHAGEKPDPRSRELARRKNIDMEFIRAQKISINDFNEFNYILAMDEDNLQLINDYAPDNHTAEIGLFLNYAAQVGLTEQRIVPDPYYGGDDGFENVFRLVEVGSLALLEHIQKQG
ncbi:MAG: protein-tyrosine phosphatase [Arenicella sp.]|jgi:protein-tyrosine phosphatase